MYIEGGALAFNELAYAPRDQSTVQYLKESAMNLSQNLTDAGRQFITNTRDQWSHFFGDNALRAARAAVRTVQTMWDADVIKQLTTIAHMQHAPVVMQRYIMADPTIRKMFLAQQLDGYSDTYQNIHGNAIGPDHYDYRRLNNGLIEEREDGGWESWTYFEDLLEGDHELRFDEQMDLKDSISNIIREIRKRRDDPTSKYNASL
jgi:hypothetical protein